MSSRARTAFVRSRSAAAVVVVVLCSVVFAVVGSPPKATAVVTGTAAPGTPQLATTSTTEQVRQIVQCGGTMYAVGTFTEISWNGKSYPRNNAFSFSATAPYTVTSWNPNVNGTVNSVALNSGCSTAYLGGKFTSVGGTAVANIAAVSASTGAVISTFAHSANGQVETLLLYGSHLLTGGLFTSVGGSSTDQYFASLNATTGKDDGFVRLNISGNYQYCLGSSCADSNATRVYNQQLSHGGTLDLVEGDFTSVGGLARQQIFMLNLAGSTATVTGWNAPEFNQHCWFSEPFYVRAASWSPDDSTIYTATTGYKPYNFTTLPLTGLCDTAAAFPSTQSSVVHEWINYTGCDSLYSTAADSTTAYFGGHERWSENQNGCDAAGPGAISAPGMEGLSPTTGLLTFNPTRGRGLGADDMLVTSSGLWIASDNASGTNTCAGSAGHAGICFLPYGG